MLTLAFLSPSDSIVGQELPNRQGIEVTESEENPISQITNAVSVSESELLQQMKEMQEYLDDKSFFQLTISKTNNSTSDQKPPVQLTLTHSRRAKLSGKTNVQLAIKQGDGDPAFIVSWDGQRLIRCFRPEKIYSETESANLRSDLRRCQFTADLLTSVDAEFLLQPDLLQYIQHKLLHVRNLTDKQSGPHFQLELTDNQLVDIWFDSEKPLPVKMQSETLSATIDDDSTKSKWSSAFSWDFNSNEKQLEAFVVPPEAERVDSIQESLLGNDISDIVGQPTPAVAVLNLDGTEIKLQEFVSANADPKLLYFWATWAAPSMRQMESIKDYAAELGEKGVHIQVINVADSKSKVLDFVAKNSIEREVWLDSKGEAAGAFSISHLPAAVVVDQGGIVRGIFENVNSENRPKISKLLKDLED